MFNRILSVKDKIKWIKFILYIIYYIIDEYTTKNVCDILLLSQPKKKLKIQFWTRYGWDYILYEHSLHSPFNWISLCYIIIIIIIT